jgi:hypothetical protein
MIGVLDLKSFNGGEADLAKAIAQVGVSDTPLFSAIPKGVPSRTAERWKGHGWKYEVLPVGDDNPGYLGGSAPAEAKSWDYQNSLNHYEIIKHSYGIDGSLEDAQNTEGKNELARQKTLCYMNHRLTIEKGLFKAGQAPVQEDKANDVKGKFGSLDHWCGIENTLDIASAEGINDIHLRNFMKFGGTQGVPLTHIYVNDLVKDQLDDLFKSQVRRGSGEKVLEFTNYTEIKNLAYSPNLKIVYTNKVPQGEVFGVNMQSLKLVFQRLTKDKPWNDGDDAVKSQVISELTLRINNPFGVCKIKGIKL